MLIGRALNHLQEVLVIVKCENKKRSMTKRQMVIKLYKDKLINEQLLWNLLGSRFKKSEVKLMDKTFRQYFRKSKDNKIRCYQKNRE